MNNCDPTQQQAVQDRLEALYEADGRDNPDHPMHGLYTGLAQATDAERAEPSRAEVLATGFGPECHMDETDPNHNTRTVI